MWSFVSADLKLPLHHSSISPSIGSRESRNTDFYDSRHGTVLIMDDYLKILYLIWTQRGFKRKRRCKTGISRVLFLGCSFDSWIFPLRKKHQRHTPKTNKQNQTEKNLWFSRFSWDYSNICFSSPRSKPVWMTTSSSTWEKAFCIIELAAATVLSEKLSGFGLPQCSLK